MSHRLRKKTPVVTPIVAWGPWTEIETEKAHGELISGEVVAGRRGRIVGKARGRRGQHVDVLGVGWDGWKGDPQWRVASGGDGKLRRRRVGWGASLR